MQLGFFCRVQEGTILTRTINIYPSLLFQLTLYLYTEAKTMRRLTFPCVFILLAIFGSCSSDSDPSQHNDSTLSSAVIPGEDPQNIPGIDPYFVEPHDTFSLFGPNNITREVLQDKNGNIWLATWEGLIMYDGKIFTNITLKEKLLHNRFFCMIEDSKGILWFGTQGAGVYRYDGTTYKWISTKEGLVSNFVECIFEDEEENIWFGTRGGVSQYDGKSFVSLDGEDELTGSVHTISQDKNGTIWMGTDDGVFHYEEKKITPYLRSNGTAFVNVRDIERDGKDVMWIGSEIDLQKCTLLADGTKQLSIVRPNSTSHIHESRDGHLLICSSSYNSMTKTSHGMELTRYDGIIFRILAQTNDMTDGQIFCAIEDRESNIWFSTMMGVCCIKGDLLIKFQQ